MSAATYPAFLARDLPAIWNAPGVDARTMEANAALRTIVRRESGEGYREMLARMAKESGIETPTAEDLIRQDRNRMPGTLASANAHLAALDAPEAPRRQPN